MSRVALLPSRGEPFTLMLTYHFFEEVWQDEVDKLYVYVNSLEEMEVVDFIRKFTTRNPKVLFSYTDHPTDHGPSLTKMFKETDEDIVILIEDDSIIFKKGVVDRYCREIETGEYDCVGSLRWSCGLSLIKVVTDRFGLHEFKYQQGGHYWPCFFFAKRSDLEKTDLYFAGRNYKKGEYVEHLDWTVAEDVSADTLGWMSQQLRALGLRFHDVEQYHGNLDDINAYRRKTFLFDGECPWLHNGTLSSVIEDIFTDDHGVPLAFRKAPDTPFLVPDHMTAEKGEMERRLSWALLAVDRFWDECEEIAEFRNLYKKAIEKYVAKFSLSMGRIILGVNIYKELIGL